MASLNPSTTAGLALASAQHVLGLEWLPLTLAWFDDASMPANRRHPGVPIPSYVDCKAPRTVHLHADLRNNLDRLRWAIFHELHHIVTVMTEGCDCAAGELDMASHERAERAANRFADAHCPAWGRARQL